MLKMLKFSGSSNIDFISVIHAKIMNIAKEMCLLMMRLFHHALLLEISPSLFEDWSSRKLSNGKYLQIS
jgi:hypothetical protein